MKKFLIFFFLVFFFFFLPNQVKAEAGKCICEPVYEIEDRCVGEPCCDTEKRFCETECGGGCTSWEETRKRWQDCDPPEEEGGEPSCHCESRSICSISYNREYQCTKDCDGRLQERIHETGCGNSYTSWVDTREGFEWQKCDPDLPGFYCSGKCIEAPGNLQHCLSPNCSIVADSSVKLPVKLDWSDVPGFWAGWSGGGGGGGGGSAIQKYAACQSKFIDTCWTEAKTKNPGWSCPGEIIPDYLICLRRETAVNCQNLLEEEECKEKCPPEKECYKPDEFVQSYKITITGTGTGDLRSCDDGSDINSYTAVLRTSEFFAPCPCFFKSNRTYNWTVWACCNENGTNCGPPSVKQFKTSSAPEPKIPYDPDWAGSGEAENVSLVEKLQWCPIDEDKPQEERILSYSLLFYLIKNGVEECHPLLKDATGKCNPKLVLPEPEAGFLSPNPEFPNEKYGFFTKKNSYSWEVAACKDLAAEDCTDYSQKWRFVIQANLLPPDLFAPPNDQAGEKPTELPILLQWKGSLGSNSYVYEISSIGQGTTTPPNVSFDFPQLSLDTFYTWKVQPCWDYESKDCENVWSEAYTFKTTGRSPKPESMKPEGANIPIPITFEWEKVPGAKSFVFKIQGDGLDLEKPTNEPSFSLDYPDLHQEKNYPWQVKTCVKEKEDDCVKDQTCCGIWSDVKSLETFKLAPPSEVLFPKDNNKITFSQFPIPFSWKEVPWARYYKFTLEYVSKSAEESSEECVAGEKEERIVLSNQVPTPLRCLGDYQWQVVACLDKDCGEIGELGPFWRFTLIQESEGGTAGGLVPCGRTYDNPSTQWNERDSCQIKHLFLIVHIILNFILWKLAPLMLVLLTIISGVLYYLSLGEMKTIVQVKSLWKAAGIGYAIIFFGWLIIDIFLSILGYRVGIFGPWWKIKF